MTTAAIVYEAPVYSREITYRNLKQEVRTVTVWFSLDPLTLMEIIGNVKFKTSKSGNPALRGQTEDLEDGAQLKLLRELAVKAAGEPSADGEKWIPYTDFEDDVLGKAFLTKLTSSDGDRREFAEKVILDPLRKFVEYAAADETNTPKDIQEFHVMLTKMENVFKMPDAKQETPAEKRARLQAELNELPTDQGPGSTRPVTPIFAPREDA